MIISIIVTFFKKLHNITKCVSNSIFNRFESDENHFKKIFKKNLKKVLTKSKTHCIIQIVPHILEQKVH